MGDIAYQQTSPVKIRCNKCRKPINYIYHVRIGSFVYKLCSIDCANTAQANYEKNKDTAMINDEQFILEENEQ